MYKIKNKTNERQVAYFDGNITLSFKAYEVKNVDYTLVTTFKQPMFEVIESSEKEIEKDSKKSKEQKINKEVKE